MPGCEVNCQIGHGKWFTIASRFLLPSLTVIYLEYYFFTDFGSGEGELLTNINCVCSSQHQTTNSEFQICCDAIL